MALWVWQGFHPSIRAPERSLAAPSFSMEDPQCLYPSLTLGLHLTGGSRWAASRSGTRCSHCDYGSVRVSKTVLLFGKDNVVSHWLVQRSRASCWNKSMCFNSSWYRFGGECKRVSMWFGQNKVMEWDLLCSVGCIVGRHFQYWQLHWFVRAVSSPCEHSINANAYTWIQSLIFHETATEWLNSVYHSGVSIIIAFWFKIGTVIFFLK